MSGLWYHVSTRESESRTAFSVAYSLSFATSAVGFRACEPRTFPSSRPLYRSWRFHIQSGDMSCIKMTMRVAKSWS